MPDELDRPEARGVREEREESTKGASESAATRVLEIFAADAGRRLDRFLADRLEVSRGEVRSLLERGAVRLAGRSVGERDKGRILSTGGRVEVANFEPRAQQRAMANAELAEAMPVLTSGEGWIAIAKPAGCGVHPLDPSQQTTVLNAVAHLRPEVHGVGEGGLRSGVVHRLDVDTSGALLMATRQPDWDRLRSAFAEHRVDKMYRAIVVGDLIDDVEIELPLRVARHRPARVEVAAVDDASARVTSLRVHPIESLTGATLVEVRPKTGFLHQIRATLATLDHPVMGDTAYGAPPASALRQMLHAARVRIDADGASDAIDVDCPDAADFAAVLEACRAKG